MRVGTLARAAAIGLVGAVLFAACSSSDETSTEDATTTAPSPPRGTQVASPTVSGPITGGAYDLPYNPMPVRLADEYGYDEQEYFIEGTATAYERSGEWGADGRWTATPTTTAPYTTRIIVRRPTDPQQFNGTVVVEWLNVTSGMDADPDFGFGHDLFFRDGYAYVGVSAQATGVEGGGPKLDIPGITLMPLKEWDPQRYGPLDHPGDDYSYDMFSQAAQAVREPTGTNPLEGLDVQRVIATGESQSAGRLVTYVNAIHPTADIYDGVMIHSRGDTGAAITADGERMPAGAHIRDDLTDPVMQIETETDLFGLGFYAARQPDTDRLRTWEFVGTAHADQFTVDYGLESGRQWDSTTVVDFTAMCGVTNTGPQRFLVRSAFAALHAWIADGTAPATGTPLEVVNDAIVRDEYGNVLGGVRTPDVDVPIATLSGEPDEGESVICSLFGSTTPFDAARLASLYPSHTEYVEQVTASADEAVSGGFLLTFDRDEMVATAESAPIPS